MKNSSDIPPEADPSGNEIEPPVDGPMPDWMRVATSARGGSSLTEDTTPAWLKAIRGGQDAAKEVKQTKAESTPAASSAESSSDEGMSDLERLLAEEGIDLGSVAEERPQEAHGMSARDWLIASSDDEMIRKRVGAEPDAEPTPPKPRPAAAWEDDKMVVEEDLPDWLREVTEEEETQASAPILADVIPSISSTPAAAVADDGMVVQDDLPDWLREMSDEAGVEHEPEPDLADVTPVAEAPAALASFDDDDGMVVQDDLPDWLRDVADEEAPPAAGPVALAGFDDDDGMVVQDDLPDWLREVADEPLIGSEPEPVLADATPGSDFQSSIALPAADRDDRDGMVVEEDLPDWLREMADEILPVYEAELTPPPVIESERLAVEEGLPDWLREVEGSSNEAAVAWTDTELTTGPDLSEPEEEEDLPDWLREVEVSSIEEEPLVSEFEPVAERLEVATPAATRDNLIDEDDLPGWLKEVQEREVEEWSEAVTAEQNFSSQQVVSVTPVDALGDEEDLPDWLKEVQAEELTQPALGQAGLAEMARVDQVSEDEVDLPDWLQEIQEEPFEPSEPSPEPFADVFGEAGEELAIEEDLPDWLQEVQAEADTAPVAIPVQPIEPKAEVIDEAGLPDWLRDIEDELEPLAEEEPAHPVIAADSVSSSAAVILEPLLEEPLFSPPTTTPHPEPEPVARGEVEPRLLAEVPERFAERSHAEQVDMKTEPVPSPDMPDWLRKLREGDLEEETVARTAPPPRPAPVRVAPSPSPTRPAVEAEVDATPLVIESEPDLPADAAERLKLARAARDKGEIEEAVRIYDSLVASGVYLDRIIEDMQQAIKSHPSNYLFLQLMGDAMMKDGRLQGALNAYREALANL